MHFMILLSNMIKREYNHRSNLQLMLGKFAHIQESYEIN